MKKNNGQLNFLVKRFNQNEIREIDNIDEKIRGKQIELSLLLREKLDRLRAILRKRGIVFKRLKNMEKEPYERKVSGVKDILSGRGAIIKNFQGKKGENFYLCLNVKDGKEDNCCGWVKGRPIREKCQYKIGKKKIESMIFRCFICQKIVGERVL